MKLILVVPVLLFAAIPLGHSASPHNWEAFKKFHGKSYVSPAHEHRAQLQFELTKERIAAHTKRYQAGQVSYTLALNEFADEDPNEFLRVRNGYRKGNCSIHRRRRQASSSPAPPPGPVSSSPAPGPNPSPAPPSPPGPAGSGFDWRTKGAVSAVQNQGQCGSCWAFSTMGAIESQVMKNGGAEVDLSEEQLVDCDTTDNGCGGGDQESAMQWLQNNGGADSLADYPYTAQGGQGGTCNTGVSPVQKVTGSQSLPGGASTDAIQQYLQANGPLSISVYAGPGSGWDSQYSGGVISNPQQPADHAVLLVGWGADSSGNPYWIVKNSWGTGWGMQGFCYLAIGDEDSGLSQNDLTYPTTQ